MQYSAIAVANSFLKLAQQDNKTLTNMKLQKLVYIAQGWNLAVNDQPLFYNNVHAFQWGPVIPRLYEAIKQFGSNPIPDQIGVVSGDNEIDIDDLSRPEVKIIRYVWKKYGDLTAAQLSNITHKDGTPWSETWAESQYSIITPELIKSHYLGMLHPVE